MQLFRVIGSALIAVAAVVVWFVLAPAAPEEGERVDVDSSLAEIDGTDSANNLRTEGAPQQAVVNGWTTIEHLALLNRQIDELSTEQSDERPAALAVLGVLAICLMAATQPKQPRAEGSPAPATHPLPDGLTHEAGQVTAQEAVEVPVAPAAEWPPRG